MATPARSLLLGLLGAAGCAGSCHSGPPEPAATQDAPSASATPPPSSAGAAVPASSGSLDAAAQAPSDAGLDASAAQIELGPLPDNAPFEGVIEMVLSRPEDPGEARLVLALKGKKVRWDLQAGGTGVGPSPGYRIYDTATRTFTTVMTKDKVIMTTPESALVGDAAAPRAYKLTPMPLEPKGKVGGIPCERDRTVDDKYAYDLCAAPGLIPFPLHLLSGLSATIVPFNPTLMSKGLFPLSTTVHAITDAGPVPYGVRSIVSTLVVTQVRRGLVPPQIFDVPAYDKHVTTSSLQVGVGGPALR